MKLRFSILLTLIVSGSVCSQGLNIRDTTNSNVNRVSNISTVYIPENIETGYCLHGEGKCCFIASRMLPILQGIGDVATIVLSSISAYASTNDNTNLAKICSISAASITGVNLALAEISWKINSKLIQIDKALSSKPTASEASSSPKNRLANIISNES